MVRAFIGIVIPDGVKSQVTEVQEHLKTLPIKAKLVEPENLHISLSFLGDIADTEIEGIESRLDGISKSYEKFEIVINGIELIPNEDFVRVIALDVESGDLESLRKEIVKSIGGKIHPAHLTLARVSSIDEKGRFIENINKLYPEKMTFKVDSVYLIKSELESGGPVYTILHASHLR